MRKSTYTTETADTHTCQSWGPIGCVGSDGAVPTNATTLDLGVFTTHNIRKRVWYNMQVSSVSSLRPEASGRRELELPVVVHTDIACTWIKGRRLCHSEPDPCGERLCQFSKNLRSWSLSWLNYGFEYEKKMILKEVESLVRHLST